ncbi:PH domain-containing protein [Modestobacter sp. VKM Ac-2983]|uniref:PH domain-containing protein n=1 Tax=Modestobacter sp. VKM Ac-2983 TaxID=3004137 RepID=UPI0022AB8CE4|nr:PH domain-containing protein [Modestobacter sp. VKM Ac-2983]MCZ2806946.1 PH domain-containing protein [Modestobacter sp. VKM Ac-2983]
MHWSPRIGEAVAMAVTGVALALATLLVDPVGRVLVGGGAVLLLGLATRDLVLRPRLRADARGVRVRALSGGTTIAWPALRARVRTSRRWGLRMETLELEDRTDDAVLVVLGRRELGEDPATVARALHEAGAGAG